MHNYLMRRLDFHTKIILIAVKYSSYTDRKVYIYKPLASHTACNTAPGPIQTEIQDCTVTLSLSRDSITINGLIKQKQITYPILTLSLRDCQDRQCMLFFNSIPSLCTIACHFLLQFLMKITQSVSRHNMEQLFLC